MTIPRKIVALIGPALVTLLGTWHDTRAAGPASQQTQPANRDAWEQKLAGLNHADWRPAFRIGSELAALPAEEGLGILKANWDKVGSPEARQQLLKAWDFARPDPPLILHHPRLLEGLDLGMRDPSPAVQSWAIIYLRDVALRDFSEDIQEYKDWYETNRGKPVAQVIAESARRISVEAARWDRGEASRRARWLADVLGRVPEARQAALRAGLLPALERWATGVGAGARPEEIRLAVEALGVIGQLRPGEEELRRLVVPLLASGRPTEVRVAAIGTLEGKENAWAVDLLLDELRGSLGGNGSEARTKVWATAGVLASIDDPRVIPTMIAVIDADNTYDTIYGIGYFGLGRLTGVSYDESHDGPWWRAWWEKNRGRYPEAVGGLEIPKLPKRQKPEGGPK
jgi:hypothetical protein